MHMYTVFFYHIVIVYVRNDHNMVKKILYTYIYHIVYYQGNCEALHEITDLVHQMFSVCATSDTAVQGCVCGGHLEVCPAFVESTESLVYNFTVRDSFS